MVSCTRNFRLGSSKHHIHPCNRSYPQAQRRSRHLSTKLLHTSLQRSLPIHDKPTFAINPGLPQWGWRKDTLFWGDFHIHVGDTPPPGLHPFAHRYLNPQPTTKDTIQAQLAAWEETPYELVRCEVDTRAVGVEEEERCLHTKSG